MNKCIIKLASSTYAEYSFYSVGRDIPSDGLIYSASIMDVYRDADEIKKRCSKAPKPGDKLWIAPDCIISRDDVRKEYKIKRKAEDADFRVISEKKRHHYDIGYYDQFIVSHASKTIIALWNRESEYKINTPNKVRNVLGISVDSVDNIVSQGQYLYYRKDTAGVYSDLITGKGTPIVHHSQVPLTKSLPVTLDTLTVLQTACRCPDNPKNEHALILQLQALNQCDWQKYIYTLRNFFQKNNMWYNACAGFMKRKSAWPAGIKQMCDELLCGTIAPCDNKEDFELYKSWIKRRLGVTSDVAVLSLDKFESLLLNKCVSQSEIDTLYNCTIRITPKVFQ